ncbi:hypothetical protein LguiA_028178 [Lonicera macranthoides]
MEMSKWIAAVASIWIQCSCGASYAFGIYSPILKSSQSYDQSTLDTVSVFKDIGANAGIVSGLLYSAIASNRTRLSRFGIGPWLVYVAGAIQCFAGYFSMWLSVTARINRPPVPLMCLFMFMAAHAQTFFNTANVVIAVQNFPDYSGTIVGIMKGFLGLSGAVIIQLYQTLFNGNPSSFLLMLSLLPTTVSLSLMFMVRIYKINTGNDKKHLNRFSLVALLVAAYLMILIILKSIFPFPLWASVLTFLLLLMLLSSPLGIAIRAQTEDLWTLRTPLLDHHESTESQKFTPAEEPINANQEKPVSENHTPQIGEDTNLLQAMCTLNFWLLFIAMICGMGSGMATINNISQIGESLSYTATERSTLVSLWSIWNFLGRFGAGFVSDIFLHRQGWARPLFMTLTLGTLTVGHLFIASGFSGNLYIGTIVVGVCYGSQWSLMPTITSEIFGVLNMGAIFNTIAAASPVGTYILSVRVIGYIYDKEASQDDSCYGSHCFMMSFFICAGVSLFGSLVALLLFCRTRKFYTTVLIKRLRHCLRQ